MESVNIIKIGGAVVEDSSLRMQFLDSFTGLPGKKILVHGGGRTATALAGKLGIDTKMSGGRRITDRNMLEVVTMVYGGLVNKGIVSDLEKLGVKAVGITGADFSCIQAHKRPAGDVDFGYVGDIDKVDAKAVLSFLDMDAVPVIAPLSFSHEDGLLNTNADTIATEIAKSISALGDMFDVILSFCFEKPGVLSDPDNGDSVIPVIDMESYLLMKSEGIITGGMIPKLDNAFNAIRSGVSKVVITNASGLGKQKGTILV